MSRPLVVTIALFAAVTAGSYWAASASGTAPAGVVSANPVDYTPHILDGIVGAIAVVGDQVIVGGDFDHITDADRGPEIKRENLFSYGLTTGALAGGFAPTVDGPVYAVAAGENNTVYVAGHFEHVNGQPTPNVARLDVATGNLVPGFAANMGPGDVRTMVARGSQLYVGGVFGEVAGRRRVALARLDANTGALYGNFNARLANRNGRTVRVDDVALSPDGSKLVAIGAFNKVAGLDRTQVVMFDLGGGRVADWYTSYYGLDVCDRTFETYVRGVDFAPDGKYFVIVSGGRATGPQLPCDTASRFEVAGAGHHDPTWSNHTGGNSLHSVAISPVAVYVGGHQQWMDNPFGNKTKGEGAVSRPGIAAIDPVNGHALEWNPTRARGVGVRALVITSAGLIVGSDTTQLGKEYHGRLGMFPPS